jgi:hypothetical protein
VTVAELPELGLKLVDVASGVLLELVLLVLAGDHGERSEPRAAGRGRRPP